MSYPEARYHGDHGEVSAVLRPATAEPELRMGGGSSAGYLATGASTNGRFGLYRWDILFAPGASREGYFEGLAGLAGLSEEDRTAFFLRHDTYWV